MDIELLKRYRREQAAKVLGFAPGAYFAADLQRNVVKFNNTTNRLQDVPGYSFTRASTAYYRNSAGVLSSFASGAPRIGDRGLLVEGAATNLCLQSQTFDNAAWTKSCSSITADAAVAPDGTMTANKLVEDNTAVATHRIYQRLDKAASPITYTASVYLKAAERTFASLKLYNGVESAGSQVGVNLTTGELSAVGGSGFTSASARSTSLANGWWRVELTTTSDSTVYITMFVQTATQLSANEAYVGDGASGIYVWGAQVEATAYATSYIPTTTTSATRAADVLSIGSVSGLTYASGMTLFAEFERASDLGTTESVFVVDSGGGNDEAMAYLSGSTDQVRLWAETNTTNQADLAAGSAIAIGAVTKWAGRVKASGFNAAVNGTLGTPQASGTAPGAPSRILLGARNGASSPFAGYIRRAFIRMGTDTNAQLQAITT